MSEIKQPVTKVDFFTRVEEFFEENKKIISVGVSAILIVVVGIIAFNNFYLPAQETEAQEQMFMAQQYFEQDSFRLALDGDGNYGGFLKIISGYKFTKAANLSHFYAGVSYLRLGEFDNAIQHLNKFSGKEPVTSAMALGALGDAYSEKGDMDKAISHYRKAAAKGDNEMITPYYLFKAGLVLRMNGKNAEALKLFQQIKSEYPNSNEGRDIDRYIAMVN